MKEIICQALAEVEHYNAEIGTKIANKYYPDLPKDNLEFLSVVEEFIYVSDVRLFSIATQVQLGTV